MIRSVTIHIETKLHGKRRKISHTTPGFQVHVGREPETEATTAASYTSITTTSTRGTVNTTVWGRYRIATMLQPTILQRLREKKLYIDHTVEIEPGGIVSSIRLITPF
jgi:hypothetical protein